MSEELKSFKISDQVKRTVDKPKKSADGGMVAPSAGFPRIEALIEGDAIELEWIESRRSQLIALSNDGSAAPQTKGGARKAALAYKHVGELIDHLVNTKNAMLQTGEE